MKSHRSMLYTLGFVFMIAFVVIYAAKKTTLLNSTTANTANSTDLTETAQVSATSTPSYENPAPPKALPSNTNAAQPAETSTNLSESERIQQIEIEKTKELNLKNVKMIQEQMRKEEITSLQSSIVNDEKLLKEIEVQGTGANDYKYIESNLKKRRARLKELTQK